MATSKFWTNETAKHPPLSGDEIDAIKFKSPWRQDASEAPTNGTLFMGRLKGTNRTVAVKWSDECKSFTNPYYGPVEITQWATFLDVADVTRCLWSRK